MQAIIMDQVTRDFGPTRALDHLNIEVPAGIVFGFLGPNGAGKTTTIRILLGLIEPTQGRAQVLGHDTRTGSDWIRHHAGALLEHHGLYERLSAEDNLMFCARAHGLSRGEARSRIRELLDGLNLWERRHEAVGGWSRGMKQKLAVARALLPRPALVFLDEPTAGLDPLASASLREVLADLAAREGVTVFLTTHNLAEAEKLCARVAVIRSGRLVAVGPPDELRARREGARVEVRGRGFEEAVLAEVARLPEVAGAEVVGDVLQVDLVEAGARFAPVVRALVGLGVEVEEVCRVHASLEEVFVSLMEETEA